MSEALEGGCACGALRYRLAAAPMITHCCHCRDCQRQVGSAFVINALIETANIVFTKSGPMRVDSLPTDSGRPHDAHRCAACATTLWSDYGRRGYMAFLRVGTLDDAAAIAPDIHIYTRWKLPWVRLPEGARQFEAFYDVKAEWPTAAMARVKAAAEAAT
ncbi:MAG: GFA family protein [Hyphomonadaceae bacterium]